MLLAVGAASAALDVIKSLTATKPASSQPIGFGPPGVDSSGDSADPTAISTPATGYNSGPQLSPDNFGALITAQSQSTGFGSSETGASSLSLPTTSSGAASSAYGAINQLTQYQSTPVVLPTPISVTA
jgi:hypothetical protein